MISEHASLKNATIKDEMADAAPVSPKRRKVLKTRIDERGREGMSYDEIQLSKLSITI